MLFYNRIKNFIKGPAGSLGEIEAVFADDMYSAQLKMGGVILAFEGIMIAISIYTGLPSTWTRARMYLVLYVLLFCVTAAFMLLLDVLHNKKSYRTAYQMNLAFGYASFLSIWSISITLLDQHAGPNLNVYSYILMAIAVFCMLRPWQSIVLFGGGFLLLNSLAFALRGNHFLFNTPLNSFNMIINSLFLTILGIVIAITLYRYRVMKKHDQMVIQSQYEQIRAINQQLSDLAMTDQLTGLGNRRFLEEKMKELTQTESALPCSATGMMLDIDFFKQYNDNYGHQAGDVCLQELADIMQRFAAQENGFIVRYGGEEFFLCLPRCPSPVEKAGILHKQIEDKKLVRNDLPGGYVTVSIGVDQETDLRLISQDEFLRRCDFALYEAKNSGRNNICCYDHRKEPHQ